LRKIEGDGLEQFLKLCNYKEILEEKNPGSIIKMFVKPERNKHSTFEEFASVLLVASRNF